MYKQLLKASQSLNMTKAKPAKIKSANSNSTCAARLIELLDKDSKLKGYEGDYVGMDGVYEVTSGLWSLEVFCANVEATDKNIKDVEKSVSAFIKKNKEKLIDTFNSNIAENIKAVGINEVEVEGIDEYDEGAEGVKYTIYFETEDGGVSASRKVKAKRKLKAYVSVDDKELKGYQKDFDAFKDWAEENIFDLDYTIDLSEVYFNAEGDVPCFFATQEEVFDKANLKALNKDLKAFCKNSKGFTAELERGHILFQFNGYL